MRFAKGIKERFEKYAVRLSWNGHARILE